jgi:hypothetical protein
MALSLTEKIQKIYPQLVNRTDWEGIVLQNDSDHSNQDYIKTWEHSSLSQPTQAQLDEVDE